MSNTRLEVWPIVQAQRAARYRRALAALRAASLHVTDPAIGEAAQKKQETPPVDASEVSTPATSSAHDGRAASAQCATSGRS
jgi:hypothetical protein